MVYVITHPAVQRGKAIEEWWARGAILAVSAIVAGVVVGAGLGAVGSAIDAPDRRLIVIAVAAIGVLAGGAELLGRPLPLLQLDRETARDGRMSALPEWAARNGLAMGTGFTTRIGFWLWYAVPVSALLSASVLEGAAIYGAYALVRGSSPLLLIPNLRRSSGNWQLALITRSSSARLVSGAAVLALSVGCGVTTLL